MKKSNFKLLKPGVSIIFIFFLTFKRPNYIRAKRYKKNKRIFPLPIVSLASKGKSILKIDKYFDIVPY